MIKKSLGNNDLLKLPKTAFLCSRVMATLSHLLPASLELKYYAKICNYWKYPKAKLNKENKKLVSATTQLKLLASDSKNKLILIKN